MTKDVNEAWQTFRFHEAANRIYDFFWGDFCDWYIELIKPRLAFENGADKPSASIACGNLVSLFEASLRLCIRSCHLSRKKSGTRFTKGSRR